MAAGTSSIEVAKETKPDERDKDIIKLFEICNVIKSKLDATTVAKVGKEISDEIIDVDFSDELAGILMTVFTCLRKEGNDPIGHQKYKTFTAVLKGVDISIQSLVEDIKAKGITINFII